MVNSKILKIAVKVHLNIKLSDDIILHFKQKVQTCILLFLVSLTQLLKNCHNLDKLPMGLILVGI